MSGKTLNPDNSLHVPQLQSVLSHYSSNKISPFTLERGNKDDGCFLEFIFDVSINIP